MTLNSSNKLECRQFSSASCLLHLASPFSAPSCSSWWSAEPPGRDDGKDKLTRRRAVCGEVKGVKGRLAAWVMESQDRVAAADIPLSFYRKATANRVESLNSNRETGARLESEDKMTTMEVLLLLSILILRLERCPYQYPVLNLIPGLSTPLVLIKCAPVLQNWQHASYTTYRYYPKNVIMK